MLKELVEQKGTKIVLSTSWRKHWNKDKKQCAPIGDDIDALFEKCGLHIYDKTPEIDNCDRAYKVRMWL